MTPSYRHATAPRVRPVGTESPQGSNPTGPGFFGRITMAFGAFCKILGSRAYAGSIAALPADASTETPPPAKAAEPVAAPHPAPRSSGSIPAPVVLREADPKLACQVLSILQRGGRFVDFIQEDLGGADDAAIGAAARVVHEGCRKALAESFTIEPIRREEEESQVTLEAGYDSNAVQLSGNVSGTAPFSGTLKHRGWKVTQVTLPKLTEAHDSTVLVPAEVEL